MKKKLTILLLAGLGIAAQAQTTVSADDNGRLLKESRRLIEEKEYPTTLTLLSRIERNTLNANERQEADYMRAIATFETNSLEGRALMLQYLADYPESAKKDILSAYIAESYYYSRNFEQALNWFKNCDSDRLEPRDRERMQLHYALTLQECDEANKPTENSTAATLFFTSQPSTTTTSSSTMPTKNLNPLRWTTSIILMFPTILQEFT